MPENTPFLNTHDISQETHQQAERFGEKPIELTPDVFRAILSTYLNPVDAQGNPNKNARASYGKDALEGTYLSIGFLRVQKGEERKIYVIDEAKTNEGAVEKDLMQEGFQIVDMGELAFHHNFSLTDTEGEVTEEIRSYPRFSYDYFHFQDIKANGIDTESIHEETLQQLRQIAQDGLPFFIPQEPQDAFERERQRYNLLEVSKLVGNHALYDRLKDIQVRRAQDEEKWRQGVKEFSSEGAQEFVDYLLAGTRFAAKHRHLARILRVTNKEVESGISPHYQVQVEPTTARNPENGTLTYTVTYHFSKELGVDKANYVEKYTINPNDPVYKDHFGLSEAQVVFLTKLILYGTIDYRLNKFNDYFSREFQKLGLQLPEHPERDALVTKDYGVLSLLMGSTVGEVYMFPEELRYLLDRFKELRLSPFPLPEDAGEPIILELPDAE